MIFGEEINKIDMRFLLKKIWREQKDRVFGRGSVYRKRNVKYVPLHPLFIVLENLVYSY
ncbi:Late expression factor 2 [Gossypium arboreum]|uniref:Late expression factor 2 n=1 Tax=Gossypium arboreum TaxID=29729 RepID=A0A0B0P4K3_GOSAR|nr:Late expression factor 2 [Gossypium arboreum]